MGNLCCHGGCVYRVKFVLSWWIRLQSDVCVVMVDAFTELSLCCDGGCVHRVKFMLSWWMRSQSQVCVIIVNVRTE